MSRPLPTTALTGALETPHVACSRTFEMPLQVERSRRVVSQHSWGLLVDAFGAPVFGSPRSSGAGPISFLEA